MDAAGDPVAALDEACRLLGRPGPGAAGHHRTGGPQGGADGGPVAGQVAVMAPTTSGGSPWCPPTRGAGPRRVAALAEADQIILGPGSLFTSVLAAVAVPGIREGIDASPARKIYICNLRPQVPETEGFDVGMHMRGPRWPTGSPSDVAVCDTGGTRRRATRRVPVVDAPLARPNGLAHDPAKLARSSRDLLG